MAFRRASPRGRSFSSRRRFGGARLRTPKDSGRWESGDFHLIFEIEPSQPNNFDNLYVHVASNRFSIGGDNTESFPRAMANMARKLEIGGIVFDWGIEKQNNRFLIPEEGNERSALWWQTTVLTDRLDAAGNPASLSNSAPLISTTPVTLSTNTTSDQAEQLRPTRIHWRRTEYVDNTVTNLSGDENGVAFPGGIRIRDQRRTESLRLKLRLDDDQGLFFRLSTRTSGFFPPDSPNKYWWWANGIIFYRIRF